MFPISYSDSDRELLTKTAAVMEMYEMFDCEQSFHFVSPPLFFTLGEVRRFALRDRCLKVMHSESFCVSK